MNKTLNAAEKADQFGKMLDDAKIEYDTPTIYHFKVGIYHNFYPSSGRYYNTLSNKKSVVISEKVFTNRESFNHFMRLQENKTVIHSLTPNEVLAILLDCGNIAEARLKFTNYGD